MLLLMSQAVFPCCTAALVWCDAVLRTTAFSARCAAVAAATFGDVPGAIRDEVVGQEGLVRAFLALISSEQRHLEALQRAARPGFAAPPLSGHSAYGTGSQHRAAQARQQLRRLRQALLKAVCTPPVGRNGSR